MLSFYSEKQACTATSQFQLNVLSSISFANVFLQYPKLPPISLLGPDGNASTVLHTTTTFPCIGGSHSPLVPRIFHQCGGDTRLQQRCGACRACNKLQSPSQAPHILDCVSALQLRAASPAGRSRVRREISRGVPCATCLDDRHHNADGTYACSYQPHQGHHSYT